MNLLELKNISKYYIPNQWILQDVSLIVQPQEILALVGPSGSGKTTLMNIIAGFETCQKGEVLLREKPINNLAAERRNIPLVFQDYALFPHLTVAKNINYGLKKTEQSDLEKFAKMAQLSNQLDKYPTQLSGGQQQRVALLRALRRNPSLILLDEPLSNIDPLLKNQVRRQLKKILKNAATSAILVTHDIQDAAYLADRIAILNEGEIQQIGTVQELYYKPKNEFVATFFDHINKVPFQGKQDKIKTPFGNLLKPPKTESGFLMIRPQDIFIRENGELKGAVKAIDFECPCWMITLEGKEDCCIKIRTLQRPKITEGQSIQFDFQTDKISFIEERLLKKSDRAH